MRDRLDHGKDRATRQHGRPARPPRRRGGRGIRMPGRPVRPGTVGGRIVAYMAEHGPTRPGDVTVALGLSYNSAAVNLSGLASKGQVVRLAQGVYALPGWRPGATPPDSCGLC